jgi:hypothetical protein
LTARPELRFLRPLRSPSIAGPRVGGDRRCGRHVAAALSTTRDAGEEPLTLSVAPRRAPGRARRLTRGTEDRFPAPSSKKDGFVGPERLPSTNVRRVPFETREPATDRATLPPRSGFRRLFAAPMLSRGAARPDALPKALHLRAPWAERRLSTSATNFDPRAPPIGSSEPRAPRPRSPASAAVFRTAPPFGRADGLRVAVLRGTANRDVTGQGPVRRAYALLLDSAPLRRDRSRRELHPNPIGSDTSCRDPVTTPAGAATADGPS